MYIISFPSFLSEVSWRRFCATWMNPWQIWAPASPPRWPGDPEKNPWENHGKTMRKTWGKGENSSGLPMFTTWFSQFRNFDTPKSEQILWRPTHHESYFPFDSLSWKWSIFSFRSVQRCFAHQGLDFRLSSRFLFLSNCNSLWGSAMQNAAFRLASWLESNTLLRAFLRSSLFCECPRSGFAKHFQAEP